MHGDGDENGDVDKRGVAERRDEDALVRLIADHAMQPQSRVYLDTSNGLRLGPPKFAPCAVGFDQLDGADTFVPHTAAATSEGGSAIPAPAKPVSKSGGCITEALESPPLPIAKPRVKIPNAPTYRPKVPVESVRTIALQCQPRRTVTRPLHTARPRVRSQRGARAPDPHEPDLASTARLRGPLRVDKRWAA